MPGPRAASPRRVPQAAHTPTPQSNTSSGWHTQEDHALSTLAVGHDFGRLEVNAPLHVQPKLAIGTASGIHEQQADQLADSVLRGPIPTPPLRPPLLSSARKDDRLAPPIVHDVLRSPGQPLEPAARSYMEPRFGHDFGQVRLHADPLAHRSARAVDANAFTVGQHIVFAEGRLSPGTADGRRLLAHELAHVVHQAGVSAPSGLAVLVRQPDPKGSGTNFDNLAKSLARKLRSGKQAEVVRDLQALQPQDLDAVDAAAIKVMQPHDAEPLKRVIDFVRVAAPKNQSVVTITPKTGAEVPKAGATIGVGAVKVQTGLTVSAGFAGKSDSAYALTYAGSDASEMRWLQFAWREVIPEYAVKGGKPARVPARRKLEHSGLMYQLTTNPAKPQWNTDTGTSRSPFYEQDTTVNRSPNELTMVDFPGSMGDSLVRELFADPTRTPSRVVSRFHAATYLVKGMDIVYRADVHLEWDFSDVKHVTLKSTATGGPTKQLEVAHRTKLVLQFPDFAYLPGPAVTAPESQPQFDIVRDLTPKGSMSDADWDDPKRSDAERFAHIAEIANAYNLIDVVRGTSKASINLAGKVPGGTVKPGLNYSSELKTKFPDAPSGETGYLDAKGTYHNPDLPAEREGPFPSIVIILGPNAFKGGKAHALATLRHEMEHARHEQVALGWLAKWRDEQPNLSFKDWLASQSKAKKLSAIDAAVIEANTGGSTAGTEVLAWTEGLVTSLPFISAVDISLMQTDARYPAVVKSLRGAGDHFNLVLGNKDLTQAAMSRIRHVCCSVLTQSQRDLLVAWIDFLLNPAASKPPESTLKLTIANFGALKGFLTSVRDIARKPCAKRTP